jgi:hypothetical protein
LRFRNGCVGKPKKENGKGRLEAGCELKKGSRPGSCLVPVRVYFGEIGSYLLRVSAASPIAVKIPRLAGSGTPAVKLTAPFSVAAVSVSIGRSM